jgi:RNA polymerase sigma-70 factor (ECF subfamily)
MGDGASADHVRASSALAALGIAPHPALVDRVVQLGVIDSPHLKDLALAFGCACHDAAALSEFERRYGGDFVGALSRLGLGRAEIDEVAQTVRERLFVARPDAPAKILDYAGRGALAGWLRAVIVRTGIDLRRRRTNDHELSNDGEPLVDLQAATDDPELENLRARYAEPFRLAFRDAVRALPQDERNALRLNVAEGLNIEQIGTLYGVHRATVARWIAHARESIAETTRKLLAERLKIPAKDIDSLVRLCQSRLDVGLSVLGTPQSGARSAEDEDLGGRGKKESR